MQPNNEFYIGWQAEAPPGFVRAIRRYLLCLAFLIPAVVALLAIFQRGFSNAVFEYGKTTTLEGRLNTAPAPFLSLENGRDAQGRPLLQNILLVAPGKFGFTTASATGLPAQARDLPVRVSGFLIYHDGKTALETERIQPIGAATVPAVTTADLGCVQLRGELTDPKCLLGVMQPGFGKPHRDCAARCIAGGIPPVLRVRNAVGDSQYYLVVGPDGAPLNSLLQNYAADAVELCGRLEQRADWLLLYADPASLRRIDPLLLQPGPMCQ